VWLSAQAQRVVPALLERLAVAVEHRRVRPDAERVGEAVDLAPALGIRLARVLEERRHARGEDLGAAAGHGLEARGLEARQHLAGLQLPAPAEVVDLRRRERLDLDVGARGVERRDDPLVVLERPVGVVAAHDVDLADLVLHHADDVLDRVLEGARLAGLAREAAEGAREHADVRGRDVAIDDEVDAVALATGFRVVGHTAHAQEVVGLEEEDAVVAGEALAGQDFVPDGGQANVGKVQIHTSRVARRIISRGREGCRGFPVAASRKGAILRAISSMLRTTIAGSLPKPSWLATPRTLWAPWGLAGAALAE